MQKKRIWDLPIKDKKGKLTGLLHFHSIIRNILNSNIFNKPSIPLVDGRGNIWSPWSTNKSELYNYTLDHQIIKPYNFSSSIEVALKEFCPDNIILLGPGNTLGGPVAQILIDHNWNNLNAKSEFLRNQAENPFVLSMGIDEQRAIVI